MTIKKFQGQDKFMIVPKNLRHANIMFISFKYSNNNGISLMKNRLKKSLDNKKHRLRYLSTKDDTGYYLSELPSNILVDKILYVSKKIPTEEVMIKKILELKCGALIYMTNNTIQTVSNHLLIDGIATLTIFGELMDNKLISEGTIPKFRYIPLVTEALIFKDLKKVLKNTNFTRQLSYDYDWKKSEVPIKGVIDGDIETIKKLKKKMEKDYGNKISFSVFLSSLVVKQVFDCLNTEKTHINIGIVGAFQNKNTFNSYSVVISSVKKDSDWNKLTRIEKLKNIINKIKTDTDNTGKTKLIGSYLFTNLYKFNLNPVNKIDILLTNIPVNQKFLFGGEEVDYLSFDFNGTSTPLYCNLISWNGKYKMTYISRTNDLDNKKLFKKLY